ncbi:ExbD/TolR family protein [Kiritimatiella glycovorans]|uniref:Biopolymer transport protein ExbD n=1 Tax=Kiritimatiella glycovorans TaxID=1307763 RepID=A0A0G3EEL3_9BACT|nr:biopolymer transporter ExbD [Kiritimatiella glycovorans]AKJ64798.1 Biopolymer transport protein ExbD [Kiritimatiella glycovorans]
MKRVTLSEQAERGVEVNMSPLIDCVFLLLIFFIVTTVFVEETGVEIQKPQAASAQDMDKHSIMIALTADGRVVFGGREIGVNGVRGVVARQLREKESPVIILADGDARTSPLVDVIDECKLAGAKQVSIAASRRD